MQASGIILPAAVSLSAISFSRSCFSQKLLLVRGNTSQCSDRVAPLVYSQEAAPGCWPHCCSCNLSLSLQSDIQSQACSWMCCEEKRGEHETVFKSKSTWLPLFEFVMSVRSGIQSMLRVIKLLFKHEPFECALSCGWVHSRAQLQIFIVVTSCYRNCEDPSDQSWIVT